MRAWSWIENAKNWCSVRPWVTSRTRKQSLLMPLVRIEGSPPWWYLKMDRKHFKHPQACLRLYCTSLKQRHTGSVHSEKKEDVVDFDSRVNVSVSETHRGVKLHSSTGTSRLQRGFKACQGRICQNNNHVWSWWSKRMSVWRDYQRIFRFDVQCLDLMSFWEIKSGLITHFFLQDQWSIHPSKTIYS